MKLRRRTDRERVRELLRERDERSDLNQRIANSYGEEIVRLRGEIQRALNVLPIGMGGRVDQARALLYDALAEKP